MMVTISQLKALMAIVISETTLVMATQATVSYYYCLLLL